MIELRNSLISWMSDVVAEHESSYYRDFSEFSQSIKALVLNFWSKIFGDGAEQSAIQGHLDLF